MKEHIVQSMNDFANMVIGNSIPGHPQNTCSIMVLLLKDFYVIVRGASGNNIGPEAGAPQ